MSNKLAIDAWFQEPLQELLQVLGCVAISLNVINFSCLPEHITAYFWISNQFSGMWMEVFIILQHRAQYIFLGLNTVFLKLHGASASFLRNKWKTNGCA